MSTFNYRFALGEKATCKVTNFTGTLVAVRQGINGAITYGVQPASKKDENWVQEAKTIDEDDLVQEGGPDSEKQEAEFVFDCGQRVRNIINGFEGAIVQRALWKNGCVMYTVEGKCMETKDGIKIPTKCFWEQEIELVKEGSETRSVKPPTKKRGGPIGSFENITNF